MSFETRLAVAGIAVGAVLTFIGTGITILWPDKKWLGWACLVLAALIFGGLVVWLAFELRQSQGNSRLSSLGVFVLVGAILGAISGGIIWRVSSAALLPPDTGNEAAESSAIANLSRLGWTVKPGSDEIEFEIWTKPMPPMKESAVYFAQLHKPWRLHFQGIKSLDGLHELSSVAGCVKIEINAGEFFDISELRGFHNLIQLTISQTPINGLGVIDSAPLASLTNLQELTLSGSKVKTIDALAGLVKLEKVNLGTTLIRDLSPLAKHQLLRFLEIRETEVSDLTALRTLPSLEELVISGRQVPDLGIAAGMGKLKKLTLIEQSPTDLTPIGELTQLEDLWIWGIPQFNIKPLGQLTHLRSLALQGIGFTVSRDVTEMSAIGKLKDLRKLALSELKVDNLEFVRGLSSLEEIGVSRMPVTSISPLRDLKSLKNVSLNITNVTDISPLMQLPALENVSVMRTPARADVLTELERRGVKVQR